MEFFWKLGLEDKKDKEPVNYFGTYDVISCPKCYESKLLGNKYYNQLDNVLDRYNQIILDMTLENVELSFKKMDGLEKKFNKIQIEFINLLRGRVRCCCPSWMLDDYLKSWNIK